MKRAMVNESKKIVIEGEKVVNEGEKIVKNKLASETTKGN